MKKYIFIFLILTIFIASGCDNTDCSSHPELSKNCVGYNKANECIDSCNELGNTFYKYKLSFVNEECWCLKNNTTFRIY